MNSRNSKLTPKQNRFVDEFLKTLNATEAYSVAYTTATRKPTRKTAGVEGFRTLKKPKIQQAIQARQLELQKEAEENGKIATPKEILEGYTRDLRFDPSLLFNESDQVLPVRRLPKDIRLSLCGVKIKESIKKSVDGNEVILTRWIEYKFPDKRANRDALAKTMGLHNSNKELVHDLIRQLLGTKDNNNVGKDAIVAAVKLLSANAEGATRGIPSMHHPNKPKNDVQWD